MYIHHAILLFKHIYIYYKSGEDATATSNLYKCNNSRCMYD